VQINETELRWLGYTEEEVVGKLHFYDLLVPADRQAFVSNFQALKRDGHLRDVEYNLVRKDGSQLPVLLNATAVTDNAGGFVVGRVTIFDISERRMAEDRVRYVAHHDVLTGLLNRIAFKIASERRLKAIARDGGEAAILFIDLDNFKTINDSLGHHVGDKVIVEAARRVRRCIGTRDIVARFGGDEFVMLLGVTEAAAQATAQRLLAEMARPFVIDGHELHAGATVGISMFPRDGSDLDTLMRAADAAMYAGKRRQRGCVEVFAPALADEAAFRLAIASQIPVALERNQFFIEYQPQIDLDTGRVVGVESLVRWQHPVLGRLSPDQFIPIAEDSGVIHAMGEWVMRTACAALREWEQAGHSGICMAVNVSVKQFQSALFERMVADTIQSAGLQPESLELEITESLFLEQAEENIRMLQRLVHSGVTLAIDDFGVGYSGLSYLQRLPLHKLKIDRSFISDIGGPVHTPPGFGEVPLVQAVKQPMAAAIISMAKTLNLSVVAEGVEAPAHVQFLRAQGCGIAQGYYFARPVSKEDLLRYLGSGATTALSRANRKRG
jgi:diguanylate cyclase (GGDEF)-like protein/PAS domain S-box-containing protein